VKLSKIAGQHAFSLCHLDSTTTAHIWTVEDSGNQAKPRHDMSQRQATTATHTYGIPGPFRQALYQLAKTEERQDPHNNLTSGQTVLVFTFPLLLDLTSRDLIMKLRG
jgi:hypothetical protein